MRKCRPYTITGAALASTSILDMLGEAAHIRWARIVIAATSKQHAWELYHERRIGAPTSIKTFGLATGIDVDAMAAAGLLADPAAYALPMDGWADRDIVAVGPHGDVNVAGQLKADRDTRMLHFVPA